MSQTVMLSPTFVFILFFRLYACYVNVWYLDGKFKCIDGMRMQMDNRDCIYQ